MLIPQIWGARQDNTLSWSDNMSDTSSRGQPANSITAVEGRDNDRKLCLHVSISETANPYYFK